MSKKVGRPKNPRIRTLENKVEALMKQLEDMEQQTATSIDEETLPCIGMGCVIKSGRYMLQVIKFDPKTKLGKIVEERDVGDATHRADFELKKFIARDFKYEEID